MDGLTEGRMAHLVSGIGRHYAAIVIGYSIPPEVDGVQVNPVTASLAVFRDDAANLGGCELRFYRAVPYSETKESGTWHWIEKA